MYLSIKITGKSKVYTNYIYVNIWQTDLLAALLIIQYSAYFWLSESVCVSI